MHQIFMSFFYHNIKYLRVPYVRYKRTHAFKIGRKRLVIFIENISMQQHDSMVPDAEDSNGPFAYIIKSFSKQ